MVNKWFDDVFMPSLFERAGVNNTIWITNKQRLTCLSYFYDYEYLWNGRIVKLYPCRNGAAQIYFCNTEAEKKEAIDKFRAENRAENIVRLKELKKRAKNGHARSIERVAHTVEKLNKKLQSWEIELKQDIEDGETVENIEIDKKKIAEIKEDLTILLN